MTLPRGLFGTMASGDIILGTPGWDVLRATAKGQTLDGLGGDDRLFSGVDDTTLYGGDGRDILRTSFVAVGSQDEQWT